MHSNSPLVEFWTESLARTLLASLSNEMLVDLAAQQKMPVEDGDNRDLAAWLQERSQSRGELQLAIMRAWRQSNSHVVAAAELVSIDGSAEQCESLLRHFSNEDVLLELITEDPVGGWETAVWVVDNVENSSVRADLVSVLEQWAKDEGTGASECKLPTERHVRVVIFGGHVRDENKMTERLFDGSAFEVRWRPFEKGAAIPTVKTISEAMASADAVLLVTTMVSHNIMQIVKRLARENGIPFRAVPKATDLHLTGVLRELFPSLRDPRT